MTTATEFTPSVVPASQIMKGKRGLIMGVANNKSIAWGIAQELHRHGAELAFSYQGDAFKKRVEPLVNDMAPDSLLVECDVTNDAALEQTFAALKSQWGHLDFIVHAIAFSDKNELKGRYVDTSLENFLNSMHISVYSFTAVARHAMPLLRPGSSLLTLSYIGAQRVMPHYNVMGVAKAALECSVRYLAADLGPDGVRVNAISAGPMKTLAGSAISGARYTFRQSEAASAQRRSVHLEELGGSALYLLSDLSSAVTGETHYVDCGFHALGMKPHEGE